MNIKVEYYVNGFRESRNYFLSFGFTLGEMEQMIAWYTIKRGKNEFSIITKEK